MPSELLCARRSSRSRGKQLPAVFWGFARACRTSMAQRWQVLWHLPSSGARSVPMHWHVGPLADGMADLEQ
eukprot:1262480-Alexandrium_andersonii.AAC.1